MPVYLDNNALAGTIDHGLLLGLGDDDHLQYLLLAGRAGGQTANGGTAATEILRLRGSTDADLGVIDIESPITIDIDFTDSPLTQLIDWNTTIPSSGATVTSVLTSRPDITIDAGTFIISTVRDVGNYRQTVTPGFAVMTLFLAQPNYTTATAGVTPTQCFVYAAQAQHENNGGGGAGPAVANHLSFSSSPRLRAATAGDAITTTNMTALQSQATFNTNNATASVSFGTFRSVWSRNIVQQLFGQGLGTETMVRYAAVECDNITFGGASNTVDVVRSALASGTNRRFLNNTSTAASEFGTSVAHFNDNGVIQFGGALNAADVSLFWDGTQLRFFFFSTSDSLEWTSPAADRFLFDTNGGNTVSEYNFNCQSFSFGAQTGNNGNPVGNFVAGPKTQSIGGEVNIFLLTHAGNYTVNVAATPVRAWTLNAASITLSGAGTVTDNEVLRIQGNPVTATTNRVGLRILSNPSGGAGVNAALWIENGNTQLDGDLTHTGTNFGIFGTTPTTQPPAYTPTNVVTDRAYDANATTVNELADVLGTLIADLQSLGIVG